MPESDTQKPSIPTTQEKPKEPPFKPKFKFIADDAFSLDRMLSHGFVEGTVVFHDKLKATYRSMNVGEIQEVEDTVRITDARSKTAKFLMNELTIKQLYHSLVSVNEVKLPPVQKKAATDESAPDKRMEVIRQYPGHLFDALNQGLNEFDEHCKALLSGQNIENF